MSIYLIGPFQLHAERLTLAKDGKQVPLGPKVVETLLALVEHPHEVLTKRALLDRIWPEGFVEEANVAQNVYVLRKTFRKYGSADLIETIPGLGYRLRANVSRLAHPSPAPQRSHRVAAAIVGIAVIAASLTLVASNDIAQRKAALGALSENGVRMYVIGRFYWDLRTRDGVQKSFVYFSQVIDSDPFDARGYAALVDANVTMGDYCYGTPISVTAVAWLGAAAYHERRFNDAIVYSRQALELSPMRTDALRTIGETYEAEGNIGRAMEAFKRYAAVDPYYRPEASLLQAQAYALAHRMPEARANLAYGRAHAGDVDGSDLVAAAAAVGDRSVSLDVVRRMHTHVSSLAIENAAHFDASQLTSERNVVATGG